MDQNYIIYALSVLLGALSYFITRTLAKIDANQTKLFDMVGALATQLAKLQGQYETWMNMKGAKDEVWR